MFSHKTDSIFSFLQDTIQEKIPQISTMENLNQKSEISSNSKVSCDPNNSNNESNSESLFSSSEESSDEIPEIHMARNNEGEVVFPKDKEEEAKTSHRNKSLQILRKVLKSSQLMVYLHLNGKKIA